MIKCKICNSECKDLKGLTLHLKIHNINLLDYYVMYEEFKIPKCIICDKDAKIRRGITFHRTCCDKDCVSKLAHTRTLSDDTKKIISDKRKKYLKENPDKHVWKKKNKQISYPCEFLKDKLKDNDIDFIEEFTPLKERFFSIDIAFPKEKFGLEINGNQHYKNGELKDYYKERKEIIEKDGWVLYDIHYTKVYDDDFCDTLVSILNTNISQLNEIDYSFYIDIQKREKKKYYCVCGNEITNKSKLCRKCYDLSKRKVKRPLYDELKKDIFNLGYSGTGRKYGVSDTSIRKWVKSYEK